MSQMTINLRRNGMIIGAIGVLFMLTVLSPLHVIARVFLQIAYWPMATVPQEIAVPLGLAIAISGGLTAGIGGAMWALGTYVAPVAPDAAAKVTRVMAWCWFCTDSTGSVLTGAPFNVVLNLSFLALMLLAVRSAGQGQAHPA